MPVVEVRGRFGYLFEHGGNTVARATAFINGRYLAAHGRQVGFVGLFEFHPGQTDGAHAVLAAATERLAREGMEVALEPAYPELTYRIDLESLDAGTLAARRHLDGVRIRYAAWGKFREDCETMTSLINAAFQDKWYFAPLELSESVAFWSENRQGMAASRSDASSHSRTTVRHSGPWAAGAAPWPSAVSCGTGVASATVRSSLWPSHRISMAPASAVRSRRTRCSR